MILLLFVEGKMDCLDCGSTTRDLTCTKCKSELLLSSNWYYTCREQTYFLYWTIFVPCIYSFGIYVVIDLSLHSYVIIFILMCLYALLACLFPRLRDQYIGLRLDMYLESKGYRNQSILLPLYIPTKIKQRFPVKESRSSKTSRKTITAATKAVLWSKTYGNTFKATCKSCNVHTISCLNFHTAHIVPLAKGGTNHHANLIPICATCNLSMGTENADDFAKSLRCI